MGKVLLLAKPARGLPRTGEKEENCSSRGVDVVLRSKIRDIRVLLFVKCSSPSKEINKPFLVLTCSSADKYWRIDELLLYRLGLSFKILFHCSTFVIPTLVKKDERQIKTDSNSSSTNITESLSCKL